MTLTLTQNQKLHLMHGRVNLVVLLPNKDYRRPERISMIKYSVSDMRSRSVRSAQWMAEHGYCGGTPSDFPPSMAISVPVTMIAASLARYNTA